MANVETAATLPGIAEGEGKPPKSTIVEAPATLLPAPPTDSAETLKENKAWVFDLSITVLEYIMAYSTRKSFRVSSA